VVVVTGVVMVSSVILPAHYWWQTFKCVVM